MAKKTKELIIKKGYTITVTSWENDGDHYATKSKTVDTIDKAKAIYELCTTVFCSSTNGEKGIGNMMDDEYEKGGKIVLKFMKANPILYDPTGTLNETDEQIIDAGMSINNELMGGSEYYYSRICESCVVTYSPDDVYCDIVTF